MMKSILVTGCSSGIGLCAAKSFKAKGYRVFASARKTEDLKHLKSLGLESIFIDLDKSETIHDAIKTILDKTNGTLDALFSNAGFAQAGAIEDITPEQLYRQFNVNVFSSIKLIQLVLPIMRKQGYGRIIQTGSMLGYVSMAYRGAYNASKFAIEGFFDALRIELRGSNIFASLIEPGPIESAFRKNAKDQFQKTIDIEHSPHQKKYVYFIKNNLQQKKKIPFTKSPEAIIPKLIHALESSRPKSRYYITFPAYLFAFLRRVLPYRALDWILWKIAQSETKN